MAADTLKEQARSRELKVGHFIVEFATPGIGHMLKNAGCDFVLFDTEHSGFHNETIKSVIRYFEAARLPVICRVPSKEYHHIARAADMGAEGIMLPMVNDAKEARHILDCLKYVPAHGGVETVSTHQARHRAHVPKHPPLREHERVRQRPHRRAGASPARHPRRAHAQQSVPRG